MPRLAPNHVLRPDLQVVALEYMTVEADNNESYIGLQVMPVFDTPVYTGTYAIVPLEEVMSEGETERAPHTQYNSGDYSLKTDSFVLKEHGWVEKIDDQESHLLPSYFDAEALAVTRAVYKIKRAHERIVAKTVMNPNNAKKSTDVTKPWSDKTSTPREDIILAKRDMKFTSGLKPNALILSDTVLSNVMMTTEVKDHLVLNPNWSREIDEGGEAAQRRFLASYLGINRVLVGGSLYNSAPKGKAPKFVNTWSDSYAALVCLSGGGNDLRETCFGRTMHYSGPEQTSPTARQSIGPGFITIEQYYDNDVRCQKIRARTNIALKIMNNGALYLLGNITA